MSGQCTRPGGKPSGTGPDAGAPNEGKPAPTPKVVITDRAREQFEIGVRLLEADGGPRLTEAYEAFKAAYAESPSPKILGNLGLCAMMLERDGEAIDAYERYVAEVTDAGADERKRIDNDLVILRGRAATVELSVSPPGGTLVDERVPDTGAAVVNRYPISASPLSLRIRAGKHRMRIELAGYEAASVALDVAAGAVERRNVVLEPKQTAPAPTAATAKPTAPPTATSAPTGTPPAQGPGVVPAKSMPTSAVAMLVVTGAIGAAAIVTGALALDRKSTYDEYGAGGSRKEAEDVRAEGETLNITTDVLLGTTAAAAIVTLVLFFVDSGDAPDPAATTAQRHEAPSPRVDVLPLVGIDAAGGSVSITF